MAQRGGFVVSCCHGLGHSMPKEGSGLSTHQLLLSNEDFPRVWYLQVSLQRQKHFMNGPRLSRVEEVWQCFSEAAPK